MSSINEMNNTTAYGAPFLTPPILSENPPIPTPSIAIVAMPGKRFWGSRSLFPIRNNRVHTEVIWLVHIQNALGSQRRIVLILPHRPQP